MDSVIQVRNRGVITLPAELREKYGIENGDIFRLVDLDGMFVLTPLVPMVPELAREIEQARLEAGLSIEDLLQGLREQRQRYVQEKYGSGKLMETKAQPKPRIFIDADVLFAGAASPNEHSASNLILRMAELTLIETIASTQVITEVERNLRDKMPKALPAFQLLLAHCLKLVEDPELAELKKYHGLANPEDLPILVAAIREECSVLDTFNTRHYQPGHPAVAVLKPGDLVLRIRYLLARLSE